MYPTVEIDSLFFQLMEHVLNIGRAEIILNVNTELDQDVQNEVVQFMNRLEKKEPCLLYTSPSPRDPKTSRMPSSA